MRDLLPGGRIWSRNLGRLRGRRRPRPAAANSTWWVRLLAIPGSGCIIPAGPRGLASGTGDSALFPVDAVYTRVSKTECRRGYVVLLCLQKNRAQLTLYRTL